jgi:hypothetical protein
MQFLFIGILSAYALAPTIGQTAYQQQAGNLPHDLSGYDALVAVDHCGLVGREAVLHTEQGEFSAIVFDCAGADGAHYFSDGNDTTTPYLMAGEVDYHFWQEHPELVGTLVRIEVTP